MSFSEMQDESSGLVNISRAGNGVTYNEDGGAYGENNKAKFRVIGDMLGAVDARTK